MTANDPVPSVAMHCAECSRVFVRDPILLDEQAYCCLGCLASGPCICEDVDAPITEVGDGMVPLTLEIGPFASQADLMHLAVLLESRPGIVHVELVLADPRRARFVLQAVSHATVASAVTAIPGYEASVSVVGDTVSALVARRDSLTSEEALLPPRTRFRVFHGGGEPTSGIDVDERFHP